jgi:succinate dehydrogenase / fumarate reductase, cytochrome b subunit
LLPTAAVISGQSDVYLSVNRMLRTARRPVYLDPLRIRLPVAGTVSLAHRISGVLLVVVMPWAVYVLAQSLYSPQTYAYWAALLGSVSGQLVLLLLVWALTHHVAAGMRHVLYDAGIGNQFDTAKRTAWWVHYVALGTTGLVLLAMVLR